MAIAGKDLDFKILKEGWNAYDLSDGGSLKVRFVLLKVIRTKEFNPEGEPIYAFASQNFLAPRTPKKLMGPPSRPPPTKEQIDTSDKIEVDFKAKEENWNEYRVDDGARLRIKLVVTKVERTDFFDQLGYPIYKAASHPVHSVSVPKRFRKRHSKRKHIKS